VRASSGGGRDLHLGPGHDVRSTRALVGFDLVVEHDDLLDRVHLESVPSPGGVTHLIFWRR
jgi:hypothetical protein